MVRARAESNLLTMFFSTSSGMSGVVYMIAAKKGVFFLLNEC